VTIREHIKRRVWFSIAALVLIVGVGGVFWWLGYIGQFEHWWPSLLVLGVFYIIASWAGALAIRCPRCGVRITGDVLTALTSRKAARRYNFCPGCGTSLEAEVHDAP
jgi:predicted RNA-binding Zn-ribbon protein involved in translation (DUF1610 family)